MACGTHPAASTASPQASTIVAGAPLATSISTAVGSWAIVPMGDLGQPLNTFWQLFFRPLGSSRWSDKAEGLAVATNGGLVMAAPDGKSAVVGVRSAANLNFSPILTTVNDGRSWSPGPPVSGLASEPDALAVDSQGQGLALTSGGTSGGGAWRLFVTKHDNGNYTVRQRRLVGVVFWEDPQPHGMDLICHGTESVYDRLRDDIRAKWPQACA